MELPRMCPARLLSDPDFGTSVPSHDFLYQFYDMHSNYYRPWKYGQDVSKEFGSTIENEKGNFKIMLDVQYFRPNEINVKVANSEIVVEGKHEERQDTHGFVTRQFKRRYPLPSQYPPENVTSTLSSDGVLIIIAEKRTSAEVEKIVPIKLCGVCPRKNQLETKYTSEMTQNMEKENIKATEDVMNNRCTIFKPDLRKETISETNGTCTKMEATKASTEVMKTERTDPLANKIEESIGKSILGLTALTEQLGHSSLACTSEMSGLKSVMKSTTETSDMKSTSETSGMKSASETTDIKRAAELSAMKSTSEASGMKSTFETADIKRAAELSAMKSTSEASGMKSASEASGMKSAFETADIKRAAELSAMKSTSETSGMKSASEASGMKSGFETTDIKRAAEMSAMKSATEMTGMKTSETSAMKSATNMSGLKNAADMSGMNTLELAGIKNASEKVTSEVSGIKNASELPGMKSVAEMLGMKSALEMSEMKSALDSCGMKSLDMCGMKGLSKMLIEESSSSYKSSSSMSSSSKTSGKTVETISDITAELREAAENV